MNIKGRLVIASYNITYIIHFYGDISISQTFQGALPGVGLPIYY